MKLFENLPSTNTPINAENLNQIQDNLVVVSATEPTGDNREKVWLQKGKNLFNKNNCLTYAWVGDNGNNINSNDNNVLSALIPCKPNTKYTLSGFVSNSYIIVIGFDSSRKYTWTITNQLETRNVKTITTGANDNFIKVGFGYAVPNLSTLMVNQGDVALPYEEYITPKTYVKNDNDVYEEFVNTEEIGKVHYSTAEQKIGTWIDGKPLYRKTFANIPLTIGTGQELVQLPQEVLEVINIKSKVHHEIYGGQTKFPNYYFSDTDYLSIVYDEAARKIFTDNLSTIGTINITIEYTKTTD